MSIFDPVATAQKLLTQYKRGDTIPVDEVCTLIDTRLPAAKDNWATGLDLTFQHLNRVNALRNELLKTHKILAVREGGELTLIKPEHHVERALQRMRKKIARAIQHGAADVANLDMTGLSNTLITEHHNALAYVDTLKWAYAKPPRFNVSNITVMPPATPSRRYPSRTKVTP